ncbi:MAG: glycosyltransferase family 9 protein, partial [Candidatus Caldarchaeum sp.]
ENFRELVKLISTQMKVYLVGGPDDRELAEKVRDQQPQVENLCGNLSLLDSAALMKKAHRVIVNDSGPLHLASAVNAPTPI